MRSYKVTVNGKAIEVQAGRAAVAVHRAMDHFPDRDFRPAAQITVSDLGQVKYTYDVVADVPFDYGENGQGTKRTTVQRGWNSTETVQAEVQRVRVAHPDWKSVHAVRRSSR